MKVRELDWRFLLPDPGPDAFGDVLLLGGRPDAAEYLDVSGFARTVRTEPSDGSAFDAVIGLAGTALEPAAAARHLMPGGVLYMEVDRLHGPIRLSPIALKRALTAEGFASVAVYGVLPDFSRTQVRFPLESSHALSWYLRTLFVADSWPRRALEPAVRTFASAPPYFRADLIPRYAVVAVAGDGGPSVPVRSPSPVAFLDAHARPLVLTRGTEDGSRVAVFPFMPKQSEPRAVIKLTRQRDESGRIVGEQRILRQLAGELPPDLASTVPRALGTIDWHRLQAGIESCAPGRVLSASTRRRDLGTRRKIGDLGVAVDWLVRLHRGASLGRVQCELKRLADYERAFGLTAAEELLFAAARRRQAQLALQSLPRVWQHWGFGDWNIYRSGSTAHVIDWEGGEHGWPLWDLLHFVMQWYEAAAGRAHDDSARMGLQAVFLEARERDRLTAAARSAVHRYLDEVGIDRQFLPLMLVLYTASRAVGRFERGSGATGEKMRGGNPFVQEMAMLARATDVLFT